MNLEDFLAEPEKVLCLGQYRFFDPTCLERIKREQSISQSKPHENRKRSDAICRSAGESSNNRTIQEELFPNTTMRMAKGSFR
jgi:hypothetical protein